MENYSALSQFVCDKKILKFKGLKRDVYFKCLNRSLSAFIKLQSGQNPKKGQKSC